MSGWAKRSAVLVSRSGDVGEAKALLNCLDVEIIGIVELGKCFRPDRNTYLGKGKLGSVKAMFDGANPDLSTLYVYDRLHPRQAINLMKVLGVSVKDKVGLILEIFAIHAGSREAKLQIEMAELLHRMPLIKEWIRKAKLGELPGYMGPGRYAVDAYHTHMKSRLARIRKELMSIRKRRKIERKQRARYGIPQVAIGGYANAGKTTLFNKLTGAAKPTGPEMFTTLSPKTKATYLNGTKVAFVDTVGFIKDVPHEVIEAFYATLEQIADADLVLLVIDSSEPVDIIKNKVGASLDTLIKIGYIGKPLIAVINKVDKTPDSGLSSALAVSEILSRKYSWEWSIVRTSAISGYGIEWLKEEIIKRLPQRVVSKQQAHANLKKSN